MWSFEKFTQALTQLELFVYESSGLNIEKII